MLIFLLDFYVYKRFINNKISSLQMSIKYFGVKIAVLHIISAYLTDFEFLTNKKTPRYQ